MAARDAPGGLEFQLRGVRSGGNEMNTQLQCAIDALDMLGLADRIFG
jgi:hypothetical protein